ncbi:MAG: ATP-NAD kinase family protein [Promethearchaeota archaeon]
MNETKRSLLGLIINPISGMGGSVGLKGTDGGNILQKAIDLGAIPNAMNRARELLTELNSIKTKLKFITCPGMMGASVLKEMDFIYEIINDPIFHDIKELKDTSADHTIKAAEHMKKLEDLKIILFLGGDGTARDVFRAIGADIPCLGIPTGVKIYSSVFSVNPRDAASIIMQFLWDEIPLKESEVLDIDEEEYREGKLVSKLYGHLLIPYNPNFSQQAKMGTPNSDLTNQERIAKRICEILDDEVYYLLGPGTTTRAITDLLHQEKTILGIDLLLNRKIIARDLNEEQILSFINGKKVKIITSLIGRQGFLFGRGNLQFSPRILKKVTPKNIIIIATKFKLLRIDRQLLRIDTRDPELDLKMKGLYQVIVDYDEIKICKVQ